MNPYLRDGLLAVVGLFALLSATVWTVGVEPVLDPLAVAGGVFVALVVEAAFLRYPGLLHSLWERRGVPTASLLAVLACGVAAVRYGPVVAGILVWGLATYLLLLGCVLAGLGNPLGFVAAPPTDEE